jgi:hypothetical protein
MTQSADRPSSCICSHPLVSRIRMLNDIHAPLERPPTNPPQTPIAQPVSTAVVELVVESVVSPSHVDVVSLDASPSAPLSIKPGALNPANTANTATRSPVQKDNFMMPSAASSMAQVILVVFMSFPSLFFLSQCVDNKVWSVFLSLSEPVERFVLCDVWGFCSRCCLDCQCRHKVRVVCPHFYAA